MTLSLDYEQRLYLYVLLGNLECHTVAETRAAWLLMDRLNLDENEKEEIGLTVHNVDGREAYSWDLSKSFAARWFEVSDSDLQQLGRAIAGCPQFLPRQARRWLEPLLGQLPGLEVTNGNNTNPAAGDGSGIRAAATKTQG